MSSPQLRIGTRASLLAQWQAHWVADRLRERNIHVELVLVATSGDQHQSPISVGEGRGVFTTEIQRELLEGRIDLAVHSLKDLPTDEMPGLLLAAVPERAPANDVLVSSKCNGWEKLFSGAVVGTSSLRRRAQLLRARPDLAVKDIRGNVDTRLKKLDGGNYDAIILAEAGLRRLGMSDRITQVMPMSVVLPAPGQGALGLQTRSDDQSARRDVEPLNHAATHSAILAERSMLAALHGGCLAPIGAYAQADGDRLQLTGRVLSSDGHRQIEAVESAALDQALPLGRMVAAALLKQGAAALIVAARSGE
jgi:hydroxymethylbilane synthase